MPIGIHNQYQRCLFRILEHFDAVCKENNIRYFLIGGALIGAVRHKGFIPWDDDIDIGVPREDYEKLLKIYNKYSNQFAIESFNNSKSYVYPYAKVYDKSTTVIEDFKRPFKRGAWIDIFPLDGAFVNRKLMKCHFFFSKTMRVILSTKYNAHLKEDKTAYKLYRRVIKAVFHFVPAAALKTVLFYLQTRKMYAQSSLVGNYFGRHGKREIVPKRFFGDSVELEFCGRLFSVPEMYEAFLESIYGNYLELPNEEDRISVHDCLLVDLDTPYER